MSTNTARLGYRRCCGRDPGTGRSLLPSPRGTSPILESKIYPNLVPEERMVEMGAWEDAQPAPR